MHTLLDLPPSDSESEGGHTESAAPLMAVAEPQPVPEPSGDDNPDSDAPTEIEEGGIYLDTSSSSDEDNNDGGVPMDIDAGEQNMISRLS
jgi:hypothetical protein